MTGASPSQSTPGWRAPCDAIAGWDRIGAQTPLRQDAGCDPGSGNPLPQGTFCLIAQMGLGAGALGGGRRHGLTIVGFTMTTGALVAVGGYKRAGLGRLRGADRFRSAFFNVRLIVPGTVSVGPVPPRSAPGHCQIGAMRITERSTPSKIGVAHHLPGVHPGRGRRDRGFALLHRGDDAFLAARTGNGRDLRPGIGRLRPPLQHVSQPHRCGSGRSRNRWR